MIFKLSSFCGMVDRRKASSLVSSTIVRDPHHREYPTCCEQYLNLCRTWSSGLVEWSCTVVINTTPRRRLILSKGRHSYTQIIRPSTNSLLNVSVPTVTLLVLTNKHFSQLIKIIGLSSYQLSSYQLLGLATRPSCGTKAYYFHLFSKGREVFSKSIFSKT